MAKVIVNNSNKHPIFFVVSELTGELIKECFSKTEADKIVNRLKAEELE